jgi:hypothetical protein
MVIISEALLLDSFEAGRDIGVWGGGSRGYACSPQLLMCDLHKCFLSALLLAGWVTAAEGLCSNTQEAVECEIARGDQASAPGDHDSAASDRCSSAAGVINVTTVVYKTAEL